MIKTIARIGWGYGLSNVTVGTWIIWAFGPESWIANERSPND